MWRVGSTNKKGLKSDIRIFDLAMKSGKKPKNSVDISTKRDFVVLIGACDGLTMENQPTTWAEAEAKLTIAEKHTDLSVVAEMQRYLSALKGKETLHDLFAVQ